MVQAKNDLESSWLSLIEMTKVRSKELQKSKEIPMYSGAEPASVNEWIQSAMNNNVDIAIQQTVIEQARLDIPLAARNSSFFVTFGVGFYDRHHDIDSTYAKSNAALRFSKRFSTAGLGKKQKMQVRYRYQAENESLLLLQKRIETEMTSLFWRVDTLAQRAELLKETLLTSEKALGATIYGYRVGVQTSVDVLNAQRDKFEILRRQESVHYEYLSNIIQLNFIVGQIDLEDIQQNYLL